MAMREAEWTEVASADNGTATATKAATSNGGRHVALFVTASFGASNVSKLLTITAGSYTLEHYVHGADIIPLDLRVAQDTAISAALAASGTGGTLGKVAIIGYTE